MDHKHASHVTGDVWLSEMDVFDFLEHIEDGSVGGVITDLPYPTTERHRNRGTTTRTKASESSSNPWYHVLSIGKLVEFFEALYPKLEKDAYVFAYVDDSTYLLLARAMGMIADLDKLTQPDVANSRAPKDAIGYGWWNPCTWIKTTLDLQNAQDWFEHITAGKSPTEPTAKWNEHKIVKLRGGTGYHGQATTERILILEKGKSQLREKFLNAFLAPRPRSKPPGASEKAASPKPVSIAEALVRAMPESQVLVGTDAKGAEVWEPSGAPVIDPFVGCGNHAVGIARAGRTALVNDINTTTARDWISNVHGLEVNDWPPEDKDG